MTNSEYQQAMLIEARGLLAAATVYVGDHPTLGGEIEALLANPLFPPPADESLSDIQRAYRFDVNRGVVPAEEPAK